ncbi:MAG: hypothetical protein KKG09_10835 [Verrucomicrobia bacterium]|nr:hypothetical protein [Verrucomicrobiota bacterium]MBU4292144.1 hypothetical protein [Verrucomicrobiota bacterium]MBU4430143.1 hypothetical protein [Verrucomicrobiota bacterium]MBU4498487.1 hypothetical protein [Verrucomicrobiota bacterium]MCG2680786.1 hypothetical protein [Kiritimatiellia bacterium]
MIPNGITTGSSDFKDRKTGLIVFGILEILFGVVCSFMIPLMLLGMLASASMSRSSVPPPTMSTMIPGLLFYALLAVGFIWMGIGSIKARRWARALLLVTSWIWLISGITGLVFMLMFLPDMYDQMGRSGQMSQVLITVIKCMTIVFMVVFYVIIPGILVLFYGSRHVKATCERCDLQVRWTDQCPLPVLAVSLLSGFGAAFMPAMGLYGWAIPFFGVILDGTAGAMVALVSMLVLGAVAWGIYRLSIKAWWGAVVITVAWNVSAGITFSRVSLMEFYERMRFSAQDLEMMEQFTLPGTSSMVLLPPVSEIVTPEHGIITLHG